MEHTPKEVGCRRTLSGRGRLAILPWGGETCHEPPRRLKENPLAQTNHLEMISNSPEETQNIGRALGAHASPGDVFPLTGPLGSGKTCLTQGIARGLGVQEHARSPTFVMVSQYQGRLTVYHIDLYRLNSPEEIDDLGLDEYLLGDGVCVVEWAERAPHIYPEHNLTIKIDVLDETARRLALAASGSHYSQAINALKSAMAKP